ncbi:hypothetical protein Tco_1554536 [Tanacetum coccineum]
MDFPEFYKELEAHVLGAGAQRMGIQLLQLELRLGKNSFRIPYGLRIAQLFAIGERHLPIESTIASRSTDVMVESQ